MDTEKQAVLSGLLNDPQFSKHQKDMFRLALFLMAEAGKNDGMEALMAGDEGKLIQLVKDHFMEASQNIGAR